MVDVFKEYAKGDMAVLIRNDNQEREIRSLAKDAGAVCIKRGDLKLPVAFSFFLSSGGMIILAPDDEIKNVEKIRKVVEFKMFKSAIAGESK